MNHICMEKGLCCAHCDVADGCDDACQWWDSNVDCDSECIEEEA
jgi:hypothetical protein